eukprot:GHVN01012286.1.p1 GENE.GHVN01012286.1~~GHVN01012286.1.p1  ORF type:complete len:201 (-),score=25.22 GHVN01012286.1:1033-1635(-)
MFVSCLPLGTVVVLWDSIIEGGLHELLPLSIALFQVLSTFLLRMRFEEILKFFRTLRFECDEVKIGRLLVDAGETVVLPPRILQVCSALTNLSPMFPPSSHANLLISIYLTNSTSLISLGEFLISPATKTTPISVICLHHTCTSLVSFTCSPLLSPFFSTLTEQRLLSSLMRLPSRRRLSRRRETVAPQAVLRLNDRGGQ